MAITGVQRYARELTIRLPNALGESVELISPGEPRRSIASDARAVLLNPASSRWSGIPGHLWEQTLLPARFRASSAEILVNLANWAPLLVSRQVIAVLDLAPIKLPEYFSASYRRFIDVVQRRAAVRADRVITLSEATRSEISAEFGITAGKIDVVPPGVGSPFAQAGRELASTERPAEFCLFVGGHDRRKNLDFLMGFWPQVHKKAGLKLIVVERGHSRPHAQTRSVATTGVEMRLDPSDAELLELYDNALCLLSPSLYEGYGLPLLEAMARGTPFISSDTGAARELAAEPEKQVLPLKASRWIATIEDWSSSFPSGLSTRLGQLAEEHTWERSATLLAGSIREALRS
ncbi:MAG: hypothetical protein DCC49_01675 [Acidobacteria bacterium]|nr:MAG: hypothetical protein DCC49_01675 [Acidobacteriota bacterium]